VCEGEGDDVPKMQPDRPPCLARLVPLDDLSEPHHAALDLLLEVPPPPRHVAHGGKDGLERCRERVRAVEGKRGWVGGELGGVEGA